MASPPDAHTGAFDLLTSSAADVQRLFQQDALDATSLAEQVLDQIDQHNTKGKNLHAIIAVAPRDQVLNRARQLDQERKDGRIRSPLHGIPLIVKDSIATDPNLGMATTSGCWALASSKPAGNAPVVEKLLDAGMILVGKGSLTEFNNYKGNGLMDGWSPVGGQTLSAYVQGGIAKGDLPMGHSTPTGSSSGSAVGVSAGFGLVSLGLETDGSIISPASRAALYAMKPTIHTVSLDGIIHISKSFDSVGGMARSPADLAAVTDLIQQTTTGEPNPKYYEALERGWGGIRLGFVNETIWHLPPSLCEPNESVLSEMRSAYHKAMATVAEKGVHVQYPVELPRGEKVWEHSGDVIRYEAKLALNEYLEGLASSEVRTLEELVEWNRANAERELPKEYPSQARLESSLNNTITAEENSKRIEILRKLGGPDGVDKVLNEFNLDAIASLSDSPLSSIAAASGYPVATMPLGISSLNGRPFGISLITGKGQEHRIFQIMGAWETLYKRQPPQDLKHEELSKI